MQTKPGQLDPREKEPLHGTGLDLSGDTTGETEEVDAEVIEEDNEDAEGDQEDDM